MVNVIIPVYKAKDTLPDTLNSLVAQTRKQFLVTLVQDCDGEDYSEMIQEYEKRGLTIFLIQQKENMGPGMARQAGIDASKMCDYLIFCDADDMLCPRAIEILYKEAKKTNADILISDFIQEETNEPGQLMIGGQVSIVWMHGKIYKRQYLVDNSIRFIPEFRVNEDSYFNLVAYNCTDNRGKVPETTYLWRDNKNSLTRCRAYDAWFMENGPIYIRTQIAGIKKIWEVVGEEEFQQKTDLIASTILNIYHSAMTLNYYKVENSGFVKDLVTLKEFQPLQRMMECRVEFWETVCKKLKACQRLDNNVYIFYKQRFVDWVNEFIKGEYNADICD